jgi:hypothetical protein
MQTNLVFLNVCCRSRNMYEFKKSNAAIQLQSGSRGFLDSYTLYLVVWNHRFRGTSTYGSELHGQEDVSTVLLLWKPR